MQKWPVKGKRRWAMRYPVLTLVLCTCFSADAATPPRTTNTPTPATTTNVTAIGPTEIAGMAEAAVSDLQSIDTENNTDPVRAEVEQKLPTTEEEIAARSEENARILAQSSSLDLFRRLEGGWRGLSQELADWDKSLTRRAKQLESEGEHVQQVQKRWDLTAEAQEGKIPAELFERVKQVIEMAKQSRRRIGDQLVEILKLQNRVSEENTRVRESLSAIEVATQQIMRHLLVRDSPAIWNGHVRASDAHRLAVQSQNSLTRQWRELRSYWARQRERLLLQVMIFVGLAVMLTRGHRRLTVRSLTREELEPTARSLGAPVASALLIAMLLSPWFYAEAPRLWWSLLGIVALIPTMMVLRRLLAEPLFGLLNVLAGFYLVDQLRAVAASQPLLWRLLFLGEMAAGCFYSWILLKGEAMADKQLRPRFAKVADATLRCATALFGLSLLMNLAGYGRLSGLIGNVTLSAAYVGMLLYAVVRVGEALVRVVLRATKASELGIVKRREPLLEKRSRQGLQWAAIGIWIIYVLQHLALQQSVWEALQSIFKTPMNLGSLHFTVGHVVLFVLVIWAAFLCSRAMRFVLEEEVYPHFRLAPGLHYSISKAMHYVILLAGFLIGLGMLGVDLTKLTIVAGAFGVGLGFGMQNIVNNFVSGIILLFERPVKVGDVVQLDSAEGIVKRIGIRASIVRTTSGSEIIVPNAKLISDPVTNWTFSERRRLISMPIAVTSETEPKKVMDVLRRVAGGHPQVSKDGQVQALLTNLNNGTANYELRAWTDQSEDWEQVRSDLFMSIKSTLAAEGIPMR